MAQNCRDDLALAQQASHIQIVLTLEVAPQQWELSDPPSPEPWNAQALSKRRRPHTRFKFDLVKRVVGSFGHLYRHAGATLFAVVPNLALLIA